MRTEEPRAIHLADYRAPDFRIETVHLDFVLEPNATRVTSRLAILRKGDASAPLRLDGEAQKLLSVTLDGRMLPPADYALDDKSLTIPQVSDRFTLEIVSEIAPAANTALEGLYQSGGMFCTQCEPEGFRRITCFLDRPDNLSVFTVRIEADRQQYPVLLSNGNRIKAGPLEGGRHFAVWHDPFPKPSYLFALVAGDLGSIHDSFTTMSGRSIALALTGAAARVGAGAGNAPSAAASFSICCSSASASALRPCASSQRGDSGRFLRRYHTISEPMPAITNIGRQPKFGMMK